jgi:hypothetical protein
MPDKLLQDYSSKTVLVYDYGLFLSFAQTLSKSFGRVLYYRTWEGSFPSTTEHCVGEGVEGVESVEDIWRHLDEIDLFVFLDVYAGELQLYLQSIGKRVWGSRRGEELETKRTHSKRALEGVGLDAGSWKEIKGIAALRSYLKRNEEQYVKISSTRGDAETFFARDYQNIQPRIDELAAKLGPYQEQMRFICEDKIPDAVEFAYDGYSVDGQYPNQCCYGIEAKSRGYLGHFVDYDALPEQLLDMNAAVAPLLKQYQYRNFFAMEARITEDGVPHVIDPACRAGSPPSELLQNLYTNLPDIMWYGAEGVCIDPVPEAEWGAELMIHASWAEKNWLQVEFPPEMADNIKLRNFCVLDGKTYITPGAASIGGVVATGKTPKEAQDKVKEIAKEVKGYTVEVEPEAFDEIGEQIKGLKKIGVTF